MAEVEYRHVTRRFAGGTVALRGLDLHVDDGEFLILVGPSGCGKSTALRLLAGLDKPTTGEILIGGRPVTRLGPGERDIAMVFQNYALYPHMSVFANLAYGLRQRKTPRSEIVERVRETSKMLGIEELLDRKPAQLSGGQRQRVAMGRALVRRPQVFLLDEPLSNLDAKLRTQVRGDLKRLHRQVPVTSIYVTHDQVEALTLGDRICVMSQGEVQQIGTPAEVYDEPANTFVAGFMGSPPMNLIPAHVRQGAVIVADTPTVGLDTAEGPVTLGVRPENLHVETAGAPGTIPAQVDFCEPLGSHALVHAVVGESPGDDGTAVTAYAEPGTALAPGSQIGLRLLPEHAHCFDRASGLARRGRPAASVAGPGAGDETSLSR